jgi:co-chaperonin GroES (HSP10)
MSENIQFEDRIGGKVQLDMYKASDMELSEWKLEKVLDDIMLVKYADTNEEGTEVKRWAIWLPIAAVNHAWRIGKVLLAGAKCQIVKEGDYVMFPNDKGLAVSEVNGEKNVLFLSEGRIFGVVTPK